MAKKVKSIHPTAKNPRELAMMLGLDPSIAVEWEVRHDVTMQIINNFKSKKLKITTAALKAETSRARITRILKGDTKGISLDVLIRVLGATGQRVELKFLKAS